MINQFKAFGFNVATACAQKKEFPYENFNQNLLHITRIGSMGYAITLIPLICLWLGSSHIKMSTCHVNFWGFWIFFKNGRIENDEYSLCMLILKGNNTLKQFPTSYNWCTQRIDSGVAAAAWSIWCSRRWS